jgi:hypothetical protein
MQADDVILHSRRYTLNLRRIKNMVSDLHNKVASFMVKNYDDIIIPEFRTQDINIIILL